MEQYVFWFNDSEALQIQDKAVCCRIFDDFWKRLEQQSSLIEWKGKVEGLKTSFDAIEWFPRYASSILVRRLDSTTSALGFVGLDNWEQLIHASVSGRESTAEPNIFKPLYVDLGQTTDDIEEVIGTIRSELSQSEEASRAHLRRQSSSSRGNQKTPSFLWSVIRQVMSSSEDSGCPIQGGTTDVGLHTGCILRNTSFPLVASTLATVFRQSGEPDNELFLQCICSYFLSFLQDFVAQIESFEQRRVDRGIVMIRTIEKYLSHGNDHTFKAAIVSKVEPCHRCLMDLRPGSHAHLHAAPRQLDSFDDMLLQMRNPSFPLIPQASPAVCQGDKLAQARRLARQNLTWSNVNSCGKIGNTQDAFIDLRRLNTYFWKLAEGLALPVKEGQGADSVWSKLQHHQAQSKHLYEASLSTAKVMSVVVRSNEALVSWICYCWAHHEAELCHPVFEGYGAALKPDDLEYLVLDHPQAVNAAKLVRKFLEARARPCRPFSASDDTLQLALAFGMQSPDFRNIHAKEQHAFVEQRRMRWERIVEIQKTLCKLDAELRSAELSLRASKARLTISEGVDFEWKTRGHRSPVKVYQEQYYECQAAVSVCQQEVVQLQAKIRHQEQSKPPNIFAGLPISESLSLQWLFFLFMPSEFVFLAKVARLAAGKFHSCVPKSDVPNQDLHNWYLQHAKDSPRSPWNSSSLTLFLATNAAMPSTATPDVRKFSPSTGVICPDQFVPLASWRTTNPFCSMPSLDSKVSRFTENLPLCHQLHFMQNFVGLYRSKEHENEGIASREERPNWLFHEQFLVFTGFREGPYSQFRLLVESIVDDLLPFEHECVHVLVRQATFQFGEEDWNTDAGHDGNWNGMALLGSEMTRQEALLRESPKHAERIVIFANICSFFGLYGQALRFAQVARKLGDGVREESGPQDAQKKVFSKQAVLYECAIRCLSRLEHYAADYEVHLIELIILFRNRHTLCQAHDEVDPKGAQNSNKAMLDVVASAFNRVISFVERQPNVLTSCLRLVRDQVPTEMSWSPVTYDGKCTGCYEAVWNEQLFSVNLLNGIVLVDGVPPTVLPESIIGDPYYQSLFHRRNFEVEVLGVGQFRTTRLVSNCYLYEFSIDAQHKLQIVETDVNGGQWNGPQCISGIQPRLLRSPKLRLLRHFELEIDLPPLILDKYSFWYSKEAELVLLRDKCFSQRTSYFVMTRSATLIVEPPIVMRDPGTQVPNMLRTSERLVRGTSGLTNALEVIEHVDFIHCSVNSAATVVTLGLPRFKLSFRVTKQERTLSSQEFRGFRVQRPSRLGDTLYGFLQYIPMIREDGSEMVIVPSGLVQPGGRILVDEQSHDAIGYEAYSVHSRFQHLVARSTLGLLHLAAIHASCASLLPDRRHSKTPTHVATEAVRQAWTNSPLSAVELAKLHEVNALSCFDATLHIMCFWVFKNSRATEFLYGREVQYSPDATHRNPPVVLDDLATAEYRSNQYTRRLLREEESSLFGTSQPSVVLDPLIDTGFSEYVQAVELELATYTVSTRARKRKWLMDFEAKNFMLSRPKDAVGIVALLYDELEASYVLNGKLSRKIKVKELDASLVYVLIGNVAEKRCELEDRIMKIVRDGDMSPRHFLSLYSGKRREISVMDLLEFVAERTCILQFLHIPDKAPDVLLHSVDWALLCVLEDKLKRINRLLLGHHGSETELIQELQCIRTWSPTSHTHWLAFEVEQQIQIRPEQYSIVRQLLSTRGSVVQLDMGMGKTRVLVPMLILEMISEQTLCRVNVLPGILKEALNYYKVVMSASVLRVRLFVLPFDRSVAFDQTKVSLLNDQFALARKHHGCFIMTPQHRNSLLLRQHEISCFVEGFGHSVLDILDESDAILSHDFQLVYAIGNQTTLPDAERRWTVLHCLIRILVRCNDVQKFLKPEWIHRESDAFGSFPKLRVLDAFRTSGSSDQLIRCICQALVDDPPYELRWLLKVSLDHRDRLIAAMSLPTFEGFSELLEANSLFRRNCSDILAIRGFLVFGVLFHGLESRYGVHYGLNPDLDTRMAVPFSACDTPKFRAQYCHPDVELVFSALAYFHIGITEEQLLETLRSLQSRGMEARRAIFSSWIEAVRKDVPPDDIELFDVYEKVDLGNTRQFRLIHQHLHQCMEVISYWTATFIYPTDTTKFPHRRVTNAWNLCDSGGAIGFSGTDDNRLLLPRPFIRQIPQALDELRATNGKRLELVIQQTKKIVQLDCKQENLWVEIIDKCIHLGVQALIDVSGLMVGPTNRQVAGLLATKISSATRGVLFFDKANGSGGDWAVFDVKYNRVVPRTTSAVLESECFVFFDENRCRGSDVKLRNDAVALVTLEPKLTKDKFLQGCARMRKLNDGQQLILAGTQEVVSRRSTTTKILDHIMRHTAKETQRGLVSLLQRGRDYDVFPEPIGGQLSLESMYGMALPEERDFTSFLDDLYEISLSQTMKQLVGYCREHGEGVSVTTHNLSEECEQEAEEEVEEEEQEQVEISRQKPKVHVDWQYDHAFDRPELLFPDVFVALSDVIRRTLQEDGHKDQLADVQWSTKIYCTNNFWQTLSSSYQNLSMYVRRVNSFLLLDDGRAVLLSAYELNKLLPIWWKSNATTTKQKKKRAVLKHLFLSESREGFGFDSDAGIPDDVLSFLKFFRGYVKYSDPQKSTLAKSFSRLSNSRDLCLRLLSMRGRSFHFDRSDLETVTFGYL